MNTNEQALVKSVLLHKFEEEIHHSDTFEHYGVKGMKWYQHLMAAKDKVVSNIKKTKEAWKQSKEAKRRAKDLKTLRSERYEEYIRARDAAKAKLGDNDHYGSIDDPQKRRMVLDAMKESGYAYTPIADREAYELLYDIEQSKEWFPALKIDDKKKDYSKVTADDVEKSIKQLVRAEEDMYNVVTSKASSRGDNQVAVNKALTQLYDTSRTVESFRQNHPDEYKSMAIEGVRDESYDEYVRGNVLDRNYVSDFFEHYINSGQIEMLRDNEPVHTQHVIRLSAEAELIHSVIQHHQRKGAHWYKHIFGDWEEHARYANGAPEPGSDKRTKKLDQVKEKAKTKAVEATKRTVDTINKAKAKAEAVQAEHKRIRDNKKEADRMAKEEKEYIHKLHNGKAEEMTTQELKDRNERMKLIKQYNDAYNAVYPDQKEANRKARRELVNTALKGLAEEAPKKVLDYAIGSTDYGKRKMQADLQKKELEVAGKIQDNKGKELDIEKTRVNAESNRRSALQTAAKNKLNTATAKRDRHKDVLDRLTARADVLATKGKSSYFLNRAIKKEQKLLDSLDNAIQKDNEKYANKIEGIYKESIKTNLITLSKQGVPEQEVRVDKKGWFGKEKHTYKKTYQK